MKLLSEKYISLAPKFTILTVTAALLYYARTPVLFCTAVKPSSGPLNG
jgi:hypothetical protein